MSTTNGLAKSWHQSLQTIILTATLGLGAWCWHILTDNANRLIRVEERQMNVMERLGRVEINVGDLRLGQVRQDDRMNLIESKNHTNP